MRLTSRTKILFIVLTAALLLCTTGLTTMAYLTDTEEAVNTFTVGKVLITLDETDVDEDGVPIDGAPRVKGNEYHLVPGQTYTKDPTLTVDKESEEAYVRMTVTLSHADVLKSIFGDGFLPEDYVTGWDRETWPCVGITPSADGKTITYEFRYKETVEPENGEDLPLKALFTDFAVPGDKVDGDDLKALTQDGGFKITVVGHAIQAAGFADADAAWAAFDEQIAWGQQN